MNLSLSTTRRVNVEPVAAGHGRRKPVCPRCRQLGYTTDCTERITHASPPMNSPDAEDDPQELYAVVTFTIPVSDRWSSLREQALRIHDQWLEEPAEMIEHLRELGYEFDLQIHLPSEVAST